jgi:hypothetical protein
MNTATAWSPKDYGACLHSAFEVLANEEYSETEPLFNESMLPDLCTETFDRRGVHVASDSWLLMDSSVKFAGRVQGFWDQDRRVKVSLPGALLIGAARLTGGDWEESVDLAAASMRFLLGKVPDFWEQSEYAGRYGKPFDVFFYETCVSFLAN